jgi:hypothetical protein
LSPFWTQLNSLEVSGGAALLGFYRLKGDDLSSKEVGRELQSIYLKGHRSYKTRSLNCTSRQSSRQHEASTGPPFETVERGLEDQPLQYIGKTEQVKTSAPLTDAVTEGQPQGLNKPGSSRSMDSVASVTDRSGTDDHHVEPETGSAAALARVMAVEGMIDNDFLSFLERALGIYERSKAVSLYFIRFGPRQALESNILAFCFCASRLAELDRTRRREISPKEQLERDRYMM